MRKYQQKQILELIKTLDEAHAELGRLLAKPAPQAKLASLLADCQNFAVHIGEFIESVEGTGTESVALLEKYCELAYQMSATPGKPALSMLCQQVNAIRSELKPNRMEVVFCPYKVSMWDSLASIWLAASEDPACDARVVPIPYFDRNSDGSFGRMHYEGGQYPEGIPVTDWRAYDFASRRPDAIFIHFPYDEQNRVTSVHPNFYSKRLKEFTDLLVYVPYFVASGDVAEHFCACPGVLNADRVIVQSEKVRSTYLRVFRQIEEENRRKGAFGNAEEKFLALGSPKFDAAINARPEDFTLPPEWARLFETPGGGRKMAVMYNTTVASILQGNKQYIKKIKSVLEQFAKRDDVVLWWRPHPLNEAAYQSMRPLMLREYRELVAGYKAEGWGIYDDTGDFQRAVSLSSLYLGDGSSVAALFNVSQKPVFYQNVAMTAYTDGYPLLINAHCAVGNTLYFIPYSAHNILFRMDLGKREPEMVGRIPPGQPGGGRGAERFRDIACAGGKLYFAPVADNAIAEYCLATGRWSFISIPGAAGQNKIAYDPNRKFAGCVVFEKTVYFLPITYPGILRLDTETNCVAVLRGWISEYERGFIDCDSRQQFYFSISDTLREEHFLYVPAFSSNAVLKFDLSGAECSIQEVKMEGAAVSDRAGFVSAGVADGELFLLARDHRSVVRYSPREGVRQVVPVPGGLTVPKDYQFEGVAVFDGAHICFLAQLAGKSIKMNILSGEVDELSLERDMGIPVRDETRFWPQMFFRPVAAGGRQFCQIGATNEIVEFFGGGRPAGKRKRLTVAGKDRPAMDEEVMAALSAAPKEADLAAGVFESPLFSLPRALDQWKNIVAAGESPPRQRMRGVQNTQPASGISNRQAPPRSGDEGYDGRDGNRIYNYVKHTAL